MGGLNMELILIAIYVFCGDRANYYLKYHLLNIRAEVHSDMNDYIISRIIYGGLFGWISIPLAILHSLFAGKKS